MILLLGIWDLYLISFLSLPTFFFMLFHPTNALSWILLFLSKTSTSFPVPGSLTLTFPVLGRAPDP